MKKFLFSLFAVAALAASFVGCTTTSKVTTSNGVAVTNTVSTVDTNSAWWGTLQSALQIAANTGATLEISKDKNARAYFLLSAKALDDLLADKKLDPDSLELALKGVSVSEIRDNVTLRTLISNLAVLYRNTAAQVAAQKLGGADGWLFVAEKCLRGIRDGFAQALATT